MKKENRRLELRGQRDDEPVSRVSSSRKFHFVLNKKTSRSIFQSVAAAVAAAGAPELADGGVKRLE